MVLWDNPHGRLGKSLCESICPRKINRGKQTYVHRTRDMVQPRLHVFAEEWPIHRSVHLSVHQVGLFLRGLVVLFVGFVPVVRMFFRACFARFWKRSLCMIWRDELSRRLMLLPVEIGPCVAA